MKYRELINYLKEEPPVYHESSKAFWDDEHISKSMLESHLDTENDGASRRFSTIQKSVEWIVCFNIWNQIYSKETFIEEIRNGGFSEIGVFDDVAGADFTGKSETICGIFKAV